jgi:hypothetical protein
MQKVNVKETDGSQLTPVQQQRYDYLYPVYGESASTIVKNLSGKGKKSWASFLERMEQVRQSKPNIKEYYDALYEAFDLNQVYTAGNIIGTVNEARRDLGLIPYTERIKIQSEYDFNLVFLAGDSFEDEEVDGVITKVFKGYIPLARIKPE